jgi:hypothetical protein
MLALFDAGVEPLVLAGEEVAPVLVEVAAADAGANRAMFKLTSVAQVFIVCPVGVVSHTPTLRTGRAGSARRWESGYRLLDDQAVERIKVITTGKRLGLPLEEIRGPALG